MHARKPTGRLRVLAVLAALAVSVLAGALPADATEHGAGPGPDEGREFAGLIVLDRTGRDVLPLAGDRTDDDSDDSTDTDGGDLLISTQGWNWAR